MHARLDHETGDLTILRRGETITVTGSTQVDAGGNVVITNNKEYGSVKVTKTFSGIDALPENFKITAAWTGSDNVAHSIELTAGGAQPENVTLSGDGSADSPYVWTISKIKIHAGDNPTVPVTFTESGFDADGYQVTVSSTTDANVTNDNPATTVQVYGESISRASFTNTYDRITGGLKVTKAVKVNNTDTAGTLADGEYFFRLFEADGVTQATDRNGDLVEDFSIIITNGASNTIEIDNLIPGVYTVMEINGTNPAVTLDYTQHSVTVTGNQTGDAIVEAGIVTITNNLQTTSVNADKRWIDGSDAELDTWPEGAVATFGVFAGTSTEPLATVVLNGTADPEPADSDMPVGYEANKTGESGGGKAIFKNLPIKDKNGMTISYTIKEIGEPQGFENQTPNGVANGGTIINKQKDQKGSLKITKAVTVNGQPWSDSANESPAGGTYTFTIKQGGAAISGGKVGETTLTNGQVTITINNGQSNSVIVSDLPEGTYTVTEEPAGNGTTLTGNNNISVTVTANKTAEAELLENAKAAFTNNKPYVTAHPEVTKAITVNGTPDDSKWPDNLEFTFTLAQSTAQSGVTMPGTTTATATKANKTATFADIAFTAEGTYTFTITEQEPANALSYITYDTEAKTVTVTVNESSGVLTVDSISYGSDNSNSLTVNNAYTSAGSVSFKAKKVQ